MTALHLAMPFRSATSPRAHPRDVASRAGSNLLVSDAHDPSTHSLAKGNQAFREGQFDRAAQIYLRAMMRSSELSGAISSSFVRARTAHLRQRSAVVSAQSSAMRVGVLGWEMSHNAAGRVQTLASLYEGWSEVQMMGCIFSASGRGVWEPIERSHIPLNLMTVADAAGFVSQAIDYVVSNPLDFVHLSKPRAPNVILGLLYKLVWQAKVIMDIDDEELGFVGACEPTSPDAYLASIGALPSMTALMHKDWTQIAVGCAKAFDAISVSNPALQARYGGPVIAHARDESRFRPLQDMALASRARFGFARGQKIVLFLGTPRPHKGLMETAQAIASLADESIVFAVMGDFPSPSFKASLAAVPGVNFRFFGNQAMEDVPAIVSMANAVVLLQDDQSLVGQMQVPAKLTDALAMGVPVICNQTDALQDVARHGAVYLSDAGQLSQALKAVLYRAEVAAELKQLGRQYFESKLSVSANRAALQGLVGGLSERGAVQVSLDKQLISLGLGLNSPGLVPMLQESVVGGGD